MLVLSRLVGQWIQIGDNIRVRVVDVQRGKIRLGIEAPIEMKVFRGPEFCDENFNVRPRSEGEEGSNVSK